MPLQTYDDIEIINLKIIERGGRGTCRHLALDHVRDPIKCAQIFAECSVATAAARNISVICLHYPMSY